MHVWEELEKINLWGESKQRPEAIIILQKCKHCGQLRKFKVSA
jgi:hypothetical protein